MLRSLLTRAVRGVFITGTDTEVGKTFVTKNLVRSLRKAGLRAVGVKPFICGPLEDTEELFEANERELTLAHISPVQLPEPAAPIVAGNCEVTVNEVVSEIQAASAPYEFTLLEGAGGWKVPVTKEWGIDSLAMALNLPVVIVVANKLGAINHTLLTIEAIEHSGLRVAGFILNHQQEEGDSLAERTNKKVILEVSGIPCLAEIPYGGGSVNGAQFAKSLEIPEIDSDLPLIFS